MQVGNHSTESLYKLGCLITDTVAKQTENITELFFSLPLLFKGRISFEASKLVFFFAEQWFSNSYV